MHHALVGRPGPDVLGPWLIAIGVYCIVGRPEGGRGCVWAGHSPRLGPGPCHRHGTAVRAAGSPMAPMADPGGIHQDSSTN